MVLDDCWSAVAPLVTLCEPLPMLTPGLTSAPMLALEFATPTLAFTPTFGFTLSEREVSVLFVDSLFVVSLALPLMLLLLSVALGLDDADPLRLEDEELEGFADWLALALRSVVLEELLLDGFVVEPAPFRFVVLEELVEGDCVELAPFTLTSVELDELLEGEVDPAPLRLMSVELEELAGADDVVPAPFRLMSVELEELPPGTVVVEPFTPVLMSVCEELVPGTTATPGPRSVVVVVLLPARASGTLGMHPAGCVLAASMHFGAPSGMLTVNVSARAAP